MCISLLCFTDYVSFSFAGHGLEVTVLQVTGWKFRLLQVTGYVSFYTAGQSCTMSMYFAIVVTLNLVHGCTELDSRMYYVVTLCLSI